VTYAVAVRTLCEFTAKRGNLDVRFTPSPSALEGIAGHRAIASRRSSSFQTELILEGDYGSLHVRGRADGYDPDENRLEEFKTYRGDLSRMPENHRALHWAQLRIYGWLLCKQRGKSSMRLALVYFDVAREVETVFDEVRSAADLEEHFGAHCEQFMSWAEAESTHRQLRNEALRELRFPYPEFHGGQRELAQAVYRRVRTGGALLAQAPTGIGKTVGTLFPALKAMANSQVDKVFYLVAKTSGRQLAMDALRRMQPTDSQPPARVVELVARGKFCEYPGMPCDGAVCPLARGFYDRLPAARQEAIGIAFLNQDAVRQVARRHQVCPYYLSQELARWSDVVVGDYNYYFDRTAMLFGWTVTHQWRVCLLVDEAHSLVERARTMYTASLDHESLESVRRQAPVALRGAFERLARVWGEITAAQVDAHRIYDELPRELLAVLDTSIAAIADHLSQQGQDEPLQAFFFEALAFSRLAAEFDSSTLFEITRAAGRGSLLCLRNVVPGRFLTARFAAAHTSVLFSATLTPHAFFTGVLGLPQTSDYLDVQSPFRAEQLTVRLVRSISTRFRDRERSLAPIAELLACQYASRPGNYLAFLSSFEYLDRVAALVKERYPHIPAWQQHPGMKEPDREAFLARFQPEGQGIGFAVLGGAFAEGIDLPGSRLIGAFVATLGLPQINAVNEEMQRRMDTLFGSGYEYTYLYPGIQKVVQAAGRVIRTATDRGVLYLIDDRFAQPSVRKLLPNWWSIDTVPSLSPLEVSRGDFSNGTISSADSAGGR
jgi:DNA excision repair protein ERCC-2